MMALIMVDCIASIQGMGGNANKTFNTVAAKLGSTVFSSPGSPFAERH